MKSDNCAFKFQTYQSIICIITSTYVVAVIGTNDDIFSPWPLWYLNKCVEGLYTIYFKENDRLPV